MRYLLSEIAQIVGGELHGVDREVREVVTDSRRSVCRESLFVAMVGENHDSHRYIIDTIGRGVESYIVERIDFEGVDGDISYIVVEHSITALQHLAAHHRKGFKGTVVGITGSRGKTIVKEWIAEAAPEGLKIFRSPRSYNSQLGVALSLLMIEGDEDIALIEAGISEPNEMARLEAMIAPDIAIITSIGEEHDEGFESSKQKIYEKLILARRASKVIYNSYYTELIPHIIYGNIGYIDAVDFAPATLDDEASRINSQIVAALLHALELGTPRFDALSSASMQFNIVEGICDSVIISDGYRSDRHSLTIALDALHTTATGRPTMVILSDVEQSDPSMVTAIIRSGVDKVFVVGANSKLYKSESELLSTLTPDMIRGHAILLIGELEAVAHRLIRKSHTTTLEVNLDSMIHNLNHYRKHLSTGCRLVAMVKANSYGAGNTEVAQILQHQGVDYLAVAFADEGSTLREGGITMPIIVLNADDGSFSQMVESRLEPEIYSLRSLQTFAEAVNMQGESRYPIHIKLDTGMHRLGFMESDIEGLTEELHKQRDRVYVASIFSHLATADMGDEGRVSTESQVALFERMCRSLIEGVGYNITRHIANSAAIIHYPESHFEMCRLGIGLYGFGDEGLRPVSRLKTRIVQIREVTEQSRIGYGGAGITSTTSRIATIPIGYADGLDRHLGCGAWSVRIGGESAPIIGRICMDSCMVDITSLNGVEEGDEVVIFSEEEGNTAEDMARVLGTISYEVLTSISTRVKRIYIKE